MWNRCYGYVKLNLNEYSDEIFVFTLTEKTQHLHRYTGDQRIMNIFLALKNERTLVWL